MFENIAWVKKKIDWWMNSDEKSLAPKYPGAFLAFCQDGELESDWELD